MRCNAQKTKKSGSFKGGENACAAAIANHAGKTVSGQSPRAEHRKTMLHTLDVDVNKHSVELLSDSAAQPCGALQPLRFCRTMGQIMQNVYA